MALMMMMIITKTTTTMLIMMMMTMTATRTSMIKCKRSLIMTVLLKQDQCDRC